MTWGFSKPKRKYNRFWSSTKTREAIYEAKNQGIDYIKAKYGNERVSQIMSQLEKATQSPGRGSYTGAPRKQYVKGRGYVMVGSSKNNAPPRPDGAKYKSQSGTAVGFRQQDGGPSAVAPPVDDGNKDLFPSGTFKPRIKMNLDNEEELAQGSQHQWAQPTAISSTITGLLRQAQNAAPNYWDQWAQDKGGQFAVDGRESSSFGADMRWTDNPSAASLAQGPMGAFGTNSGLGMAAGNQNFCAICKSPGHSTGGHTAANDIRNQPPGTTPPGTTPPGNTAPPAATPPGTTPPAGPPMIPIGQGPIVPGDVFQPSPDQNYNPWARLEGGEFNNNGPTGNKMAQSTMEAMNLANAYFAPQRMELAYELGDMETDMRRLAVNLGRQTDDPVLQAKMYKEAMRATRTLDVQQNTFAFQMAEQRRKEELQNYQFYDQLGQEEARLKLQNRQFIDQLELQRRYYNLQNWNVVNNSSPTGSAPPPPAAAQAGQMAQRPLSLVQNQFPNPTGTRPQPSRIGGLSASLLNNNPYASTGGAGNVTRSTWGL